MWCDLNATKFHCFDVWLEEDLQRLVSDGLDGGLANLANRPLITAVYKGERIDFLYVPGQKGKKWMCWLDPWSPASWLRSHSITRWPSRHVCARMLLLLQLLLSVYLPWQCDGCSFRQKRSEQVQFWSNCVSGSQILCEGRSEQPLKTTTSLLFGIYTKIHLSSVAKCSSATPCLLDFPEVAHSYKISVHVTKVADTLIMKTRPAMCWLHLLTEVSAYCHFSHFHKRLKKVMWNAIGLF